MTPKLMIDLLSGTPVTRQIVDNLRVLLVAGQLSAGAELPSVRRMAMELNIHFNTVADAYRLLASEGWLDLKHGRSARIVDRDLPRPSQVALRNWRTRLKQLAAQMLAAGIPNSEVANELRNIAKELMQ
jgi:GntR family transcriptional regulator